MKRKTLNLRIALALMTISIVMSASPTVRADAVTDWNAKTVGYVSAPGVRPGPTWVLDVAVVQVAIYDAVQAIEGDYEPYCGSIPGAAGSTDAAAARAARDVLLNRFSTNVLMVAAINADYNLYVAAINPLDPGFAVGAAAAQCVNTMRATDGAFPTGWPAFVGNTAIGQWRASPGALTFSWLADVTPFTMRSSDQFRAGPPPRLTSPEYTRAYNEVMELGSLASTFRTADQTDLANFWNANFPGLFNKLARELAISEGLSISESSRLMALVDVSMADAAITAWDSKMHYNFWRPATAIQFGNFDGNPKTIGDPGWTPMIPTPPYSDHTSGANNLAGSSTRAMALFFGSNRMDFDIATTNPGPTVDDIRSYTRLSEVRDEVEESRILQGIHFRFADSDARRQGEHIAQGAHAHFFKPAGNN